MNITVIGANGFIGRRLCEVCVKRGDSVNAMVRNPNTTADLKSMGAAVHIGKITDKDALIGVCVGADIVFNAAGALGKWKTSFEELDLINTYGAGLVVRCSAEAGAKKVVHISTAGVSGPIPVNTAGTESYPIAPVTDYQRTKLEGERAATVTYMETGVPLVIVRPSFVYGPGDLHKLSLFKLISSGKMIYINNGISMLHPVYIDDVISGLLTAGERAPGEGDIYIIAGGRPVTTRELIIDIAHALSAPVPKFSLPSSILMPAARLMELAGMVVDKEPPLTRSKVGLFSENYIYSIDKAWNDIGYRPLIDLPEGIRRTADWYLTHGHITSGGRKR